MAAEIKKPEIDTNLKPGVPLPGKPAENGEGYRQPRGRGRGGFRGGRGGPPHGAGRAISMQDASSASPENTDSDSRGRGRGRGGRGRGRGFNAAGSLPMIDKIAERLKQISGPQVDLTPREEGSRKFSNHCRLWIGNLPLDINEDDVKDLFKPFGEFDEVYFDKSKGFAFVRMDFKSNAEKAKQELHMKEYRGRQLKIRFSSPGTALKVRNLSHQVSNELLERAFGVFGELEKCIVVTDERGRPTGEGILEYCKKPSALQALKRCQEGCFFITSSPRPVIVETMSALDENEGMGEVNVNKRHPDYMKERQIGPRFANPGSFEFEYGLKWKQLYELFDKKKEMLEKELSDEKSKLEEQIEYAKYQHETEMLKEQLRHREEQGVLQQEQFEQRQREWESHRRQEEERQQRIEEELSLKFRQQEEELRRRQEENRQFMQERASDLMKSENSQETYGAGGYQEMSSWRSADGYANRGGNWRGGGGGISRGGMQSQNWVDSWESRREERSFEHGAETELGVPQDPRTFMDSFNRGRNFEEAPDFPRRDAGRSRWGNLDHDDYGPTKRARY